MLFCEKDIYTLLERLGSQGYQSVSCTQKIMVS